MVFFTWNVPSAYCATLLTDSSDCCFSWTVSVLGSNVVFAVFHCMFGTAGEASSNVIVVPAGKVFGTLVKEPATTSLKVTEPEVSEGLRPAGLSVHSGKSATVLPLGRVKLMVTGYLVVVGTDAAAGPKTRFTIETAP